MCQVISIQELVDAEEHNMVYCHNCDLLVEVDEGKYCGECFSPNVWSPEKCFENMEVIDTPALETVKQLGFYDLFKNFT